MFSAGTSLIRIFINIKCIQIIKVYKILKLNFHFPVQHHFDPPTVRTRNNNNNKNCLNEVLYLHKAWQNSVQNVSNFSKPVVLLNMNRTSIKWLLSIQSQETEDANWEHTSEEHVEWIWRDFFCIIWRIFFISMIIFDILPLVVLYLTKRLYNG